MGGTLSRRIRETYVRSQVGETRARRVQLEMEIEKIRKSIKKDKERNERLLGMMIKQKDQLESLKKDLNRYVDERLQGAAETSKDREK